MNHVTRLGPAAADDPARFWKLGVLPSSSFSNLEFSKARPFSNPHPRPFGDHLGTI